VQTCHRRHQPESIRSGVLLRRLPRPGGAERVPLDAQPRPRALVRRGRGRPGGHAAHAGLRGLPPAARAVDGL
ncbi:MAG: hypothetical protein AVDCRST_MAG08-3989, partial [uncultured Acetobacteraceae bacterium]